MSKVGVWGQCQGITVYGVIQGNAPCYGYTGTADALINNVTCACTGPWRYVLCSQSGTPLQYSPSINTFTLSTSAQFTNLQPGTYKMKFVTSNFPLPNGCPNSEITFTIGQPPPIDLSLVTQPLLCNYSNNGSISLTATGGTPNSPPNEYNYTWTASNGGVIPSNQQNSEDPTGLVAGDYSITVSDFNNCTATSNINITAPSPITPTFNMVNAVCPTSTGSITVGGLGTGDGTPGNVGFNVAWQLTGSTLNNPAGVEIPAPGFLSYAINNLSPGTYSVTITDNSGCVNSTQQIVGVTNPSPIISGNDEICAGSTSQLQITNNQPPASGNPWSSSNNAIAQVSSSGLVTAISAGIVTITYTSSAGCIGTYPIEVKPTPVITDPADVTICAGASATLTSTSNPNTAVYNYQWSSSSNPQNGVTSSSITVSPTTTTTYTVTATNPTTGCSASQTATVTVNPLPTISGESTVCVNATTQLTGSATAASSNAWTSNNTGVATISNTGLVTAVSLGITDITYTNSNGCSITMTLTVNSFPTITGPNSVCVGSSIQLAGTGTTASWSSSNTAVANVTN
ncbi:MAG: Ig domain-containing protein, partial [Bacteroidota bacterium]